MNDGGGVNAGSVFRLTIEKLHGFGERQIRIRGAKRGGGDFGKIWRDDDRAGVGGAGQGRVSGVCDEGNMLRGGLFNARDSLDQVVRAAMQIGTEGTRKLS